MTTPTFTPGDAVKIHGRNAATVTSVHRNGKTIGITFADGKATYVTACKATLVAPVAA